MGTNENVVKWAKETLKESGHKKSKIDDWIHGADKTGFWLQCQVADHKLKKFMKRRDRDRSTIINALNDVSDREITAGDDSILYRKDETVFSLVAYADLKIGMRGIVTGPATADPEDNDDDYGFAVVFADLKGTEWRLRPIDICRTNPSRMPTYRLVSRHKNACVAYRNKKNLCSFDMWDNEHEHLKQGETVNASSVEGDWIKVNHLTKELWLPIVKNGTTLLEAIRPKYRMGPPPETEDFARIKGVMENINLPYYEFRVTMSIFEEQYITQWRQFVGLELEVLKKIGVYSEPAHCSKCNATVKENEKDGKCIKNNDGAQLLL